ncbi:endo alpha-1,4 polygalactosaminidase [Chitinophaga sp.]|uniref:endo alpha-1,4 polygalactosaminidase n=1 Tax=Chitinophaga sp. TaxID=1869181 RepID=UPI0031E0EF66
MRPILLISFALFVLSACSKNNDTDTTSGSNNDSAAAAADTTPSDYKQSMRDFVIGISKYAKAAHAGFIVVPQNGIELVTKNGESSGTPDTAYLNAIDANGQEDLYYGYDDDDVATPTSTINYLNPLLKISKNAGNTILVTDYCSTHSKMTDSYTKNNAQGYISFAADSRGLDDIPAFPSPIYAENTTAVTSIGQVKNFLYLIDPASGFSSKTAFINAVKATNYDLLITDLYFDTSAFTASELAALKKKANGGTRLVISYMSIGEAENYRYYWQTSWTKTKPAWLDAENPDWPGNYKVKYWYSDWQKIIYGNDSSYTKKILNAGFDGVYLDIIDAFEYYEK